MGVQDIGVGGGHGGGGLEVEGEFGGKRETDLRVTAEKQMSQSLCQSTDLQTLNHTHKNTVGVNP